MQRCSIHFSSEKINWKLTITLCLNKLFPSNCPHTKICFVVIIASLQYNFEKYIHWTYLILLSQSIKLKWKICVGWTCTTSKKLYAHVPEKKRLINSNVDVQESKQGLNQPMPKKEKTSFQEKTDIHRHTFQDVMVSNEHWNCSPKVLL